jgi:pyruvate/2-oxoglutarate dehydrogenase complex dihydrolipoamide dehydrogenase (E3) component
MIHSAKVASLARRGPEFGVFADSVRIDMAVVQRRKRQMVAGLHEMHVDRTRASGAELIFGEGRFTAPATIEIALKAGGVRHITGEKIFLALGSRSSMPHVPGLLEAHPMTHVEALDLERLPEHLIMIGGGYVGLELAQAMRRFGARVTVIEEGPQLASHEDADVGEALLNLFHDEGIEVLLRTSLRQVEGRSGEKVRVQAKSDKAVCVIEGSDLLVATGRKANTEGIGLERVGVELDARGYIRVNSRLETTAPNIWAMGDCAGSPHFTHVAYDDFRTVYANLAGGNRTTMNRLVPFCMFTDPELARVGRNEVEARRTGTEYRLAKLDMHAVLRARTVSETRGFMKILVGKNSDEILGFTAFGWDASEPMAVVQTAMIAQMPYTALRDAILTHPTMAEGLISLVASIPLRS